MLTLGDVFDGAPDLLRWLAPAAVPHLSGMPPVALVAGPALVVADMIFVVHLRRLHVDTPRWPFCLAAAVIGGMLVGPTRDLLTSPLGALTELLPINWG